MKYLLCLAALAAMLSGCASSQPMSPEEAADRGACRKEDAPTGSNLVRRDLCSNHRKS